MKSVFLRLSAFLSIAMALSRVSAADTGTVQGSIKYLPDSKRPWRFSRYYIQNPKTGFLAETVVALERPGLGALAPPAPPNKCTMDQLNYQFVPETLAIRAGDTVIISNSDDALHNVMTSDGAEPFNVNVVKGKEFAHTFNQAGGLERPVRLGCVFHGAMRAWIYVFDHPWFQLTQKDGQFRLENVPAGEYTLGVVHPAGKLRSRRQIEVKANMLTSSEISLSPDDLIAPTSASLSPPREEKGPSLYRDLEPAISVSKLSGLYELQEKAAWGCRTPQPCGGSRVNESASASWSAAALCRFQGEIAPSTGLRLIVRDSAAKQ